MVSQFFGISLKSIGHINEFIICCGYKGYLIKEYFANYFTHMSDVTFHMYANQMEVHHKKAEPWEVTLVDTGEKTMTGGRLKRIQEYLNDEPFCFTYGDGVADVDIASLISHHKAHGRLGTVTAVQPPGRFGALQFGDKYGVTGFQEKPQGDGRINGGFFVLEPQVLDRIDGDHITWEQEPLLGLAADNQLTAFYHNGFWQPMDTLRDRTLLEKLWSDEKAPWKIWE